MASNQTKTHREVKIKGNEGIVHSDYSGNKLALSRYTWLTLIPKSLFEQFHRTSNIWFLIVSVFQLIPFQLNPTDSWTTILPLGILLLVTTIKDWYIDHWLSKKDEIFNSSLFPRWNGSEFIEVKSEDLLVGQFVIVRENQIVPADMIIVTSTNSGKIFLDMTKLVGFSSMQKKLPVEKLAKTVGNDVNMLNLNKIQGKLLLHEPNSDFNNFVASMRLSGFPGAIDMNLSNCMFRGGVLKGETAVVGLIVYCGKETKLKLNTCSIRKKTSRIENIVNTWVLYLLVILSVLVIFSILGFYFIGKDNKTKYDFLEPLITFTLLYNNITPISLFLVIDMIRLFQQHFFSKKCKDIRFNIETVNENLGQVEYLLTDKTGCITENELSLKMCQIGDLKYEKTSEVSEKEQVLVDTNQFLDSTYRPNQIITNTFEQLAKTLEDDLPGSTISHFFKCMTLCNDLYEHNEELLGSADEIALVQASKSFGFVKTARNDVYELSGNGGTEYFRVVESRAYSKLKMRSRILLEESTGTGILYVKGSSEAMIPLLDLTSSQVFSIKQTMRQMADKGLRTMILACKKITVEDILETKSKIQRIKKSLLNPESRIEAMFKDLEKNLKFLGVTGIGENLLPGALETIANLKKAGIKIWLTSSDSLNSSVLTAKQGQIIEADSLQLELINLKTEAACCKAFLQATSTFILLENVIIPSMSAEIVVRRRSRIAENPQFPQEDDENSSSNRLPEKFLSGQQLQNKVEDLLDKPFDASQIDYSVIIDRDTFQTAMKYLNCRKLLTNLLICAKSVCFVGLMPIDKGKVVSFLKGNVSFHPLVAAIGSGEGDINMLQTSDVGIAIQNGENLLVLNYADICINRFERLTELLLIEGHWNYRRMSKAILLFIYKNCFLTVVLFAYTFVCSYSGTSIFNASLLVGFNLFFTSFPILVIGVFDEDTHRSEIMERSKVYSMGVENSDFNWKSLCYCLGQAVVQGVILVVLVFIGFPNIVTPHGDTAGFYLIGSVIYITLVFSVLIQINLVTCCYSIIYCCSQLLSIALLMIFISIVDNTNIPNSDLRGIGQMIRMSPIFLISIFITSLICILPNYALSIAYNLFAHNVNKSNYSFASSINAKLVKFQHKLSNLYCNSSNWKNKALDEKFSMNKFSLKFNLPHLEKKFTESIISENLNEFKFTVAFLWLLIILWTVFGATIFSTNLSYLLSRIVISSICSIALFILWTENFKKNFQGYMLALIFFAIITNFILELSFLQSNMLAGALVPSVTFLILNVHWLSILFLNVLNFVLFIIANAIELSHNHEDASKAALLASTDIILLLAIILTSGLVGYFLEISKRIEHKLMNKAHGAVERIQSILGIMLPPFVRTRVKEGVRYIADDQGEVTIVFCDICDFDSICKEYTPKEFTDFLDNLFSSFDVLCENVGVTKIETVGKTYMACSGLKDSDKDLPQALRKQPHARRAIEVAFAMIQEVNSVELKNGSTLQVKIGINSGTVAAGVVGFHKPQFSLVGDTVNTASRMCSTLDTPNSIQISESTFELLFGYPDLEFAKRQVFAKGKGNIDVYKTTEAKPDNSDVAGGCVNKSFGNSNSNFFSEILPEETEVKKKNPSQSRPSRRWKEEIMKRKDPQLIQYSPLMKISCSESLHEKEFRLKRLEQNYYSVLISLYIAVFTFFLMTIFAISGNYTDKNTANEDIIIGRSCVVIFLLGIIFLHKHLFKKIYYPYIIIGCLGLMTSIVLIQLSSGTQVPEDFIGLELMYIIVIANHTCAASLPMVLFVNVCIFIPWIALSINTPSQSLHLSNAVLVSGFSLINFKAIYKREKSDRANHNLGWLTEKEIKENETLLIQMMPPRVLENLENGKSVTDRLLQVTLIFADIVGFTNWSSDKSPEEVVKMLSGLFKRFDKLCLKYDVYKVHTIGDCYVVMGDVGKRKRDPSKECLNMMQMAFSMIEVIKKENVKHGSDLNMRIGVHTGEIIAGIIGTMIVRYDIWGPDVLIANKMESNGMLGKVKVSEDTKNMIQSRYFDGYLFEESEDIEVPAIGVVKKSYFVTSCDARPDDVIE